MPDNARGGAGSPFGGSLPPIHETPSSSLDRSLASPPSDVTPDLPPVDAPPQRTWPVRPAQLQAEYVSGGGYVFLANYIRSLPHWIDDTTRDLGEDLYERMMLDPQVNSAIRLLKLAALSSGVRFDPAIENENDEWDDGTSPESVSTDNQPRDRIGGRRTKTEDELIAEAIDEEAEKKLEQTRVEAKLAAEICDFCQDVIENLDGNSFLQVLYEMLDAIAFGNKVAEQVYDMAKDANGKQRIVLKSLKIKPRNSTAFVVDAYLNVIGLVAIMPGKGYPVTVGSIIATPTQIPNLLPREKFAILTWAPRDGDPRGTSLLRPVYNPWWMKMQVQGEYAKYLAQFAGPSLIGFTAPGAVSVPQMDSLGNVIPGAPLITPEQAMLNALVNFRSSSVIALPNGTDVRPLNMAGNGEAFKEALVQYNGEISKGILCQTLATEEGVHMAKAASETHQDVLDLVIHHVKQALQQMIRRDILYPLVRYNWGEEAARRLTPKVHLSQTQQHNWAKDAGAVGSLAQAGYLDPSQYRELDARLGLPKRKVGAAPQQPDPNAPPEGAPPGVPGAPPGPPAAAGPPGKPAGPGRPPGPAFPPKAPKPIGAMGTPPGPQPLPPVSPPPGPVQPLAPPPGPPKMKFGSG